MIYFLYHFFSIYTIIQQYIDFFKNKNINAKIYFKKLEFYFYAYNPPKDIPIKES